MGKEKRASYQKEYREKSGDKMKEQIKEWYKEHLDYSKQWKESHPGYFTHRGEKQRNRLRKYMKFYMRKYRKWLKLRSNRVNKKNLPLDVGLNFTNHYTKVHDVIAEKNSF